MKKISTNDFLTAIFNCPHVDKEGKEYLCGSLMEAFEDIDNLLAKQEYFTRNLIFDESQYSNIVKGLHALLHTQLIYLSTLCNFNELPKENLKDIGDFLLAAIINSYVAGIMTTQKSLSCIEIDEKELS